MALFTLGVKSFSISDTFTAAITPFSKVFWFTTIIDHGKGRYPWFLGLLRSPKQLKTAEGYC